VVRRHDRDPLELEVVLVPGHSQAELRSEQRLPGRRAEHDDHLRVDELELGVEPLLARHDLPPVRLVVEAALAACLPLEVLDRVREIHVAPLDLRVGERLVEDASGRSDERVAGEVLAVAGLLAHQHHAGRRRAFPEHGLRRPTVEIAGFAVRGVGRHLLERARLRHRGCASGSVGQRGDPDLQGAVGAAEEVAVGLDAVADDLRTALLAPGCGDVDRALEAVEDVGAPVVRRHGERLVVLVAAAVTRRHRPSLVARIGESVPGPGRARNGALDKNSCQ
jgi:hypothetical protein